jgi:hypothetical protein
LAECPDIDILGTTFILGDAFIKKEELNKPILFTVRSVPITRMLKIKSLRRTFNKKFKNAAGLGKAGNSIGGFTFQFSDGWWKYGQTKI